MENTTAAVIPVSQMYGNWTRVNYRLTPIVRGKVHCLHVETAKLVELAFPRDTGSWAEGAQGEFAAIGQAISRDGEPGGDYIVATRVARGSIPCIDLRGVKDTVGAAAGCELIGGAVHEVLNSAANASGKPLQHFCSLPVWTSGNPHPDGAEQIGTDGTLFCYSGRGAALNDMNGREADAAGNYLPSSRFPHVIYVGGYLTIAAKRPATAGGWPIKVQRNSPIVWRPVSPNLTIGSPLTGSSGCP